MPGGMSSVLLKYVNAGTIDVYVEPVHKSLAVEGLHDELAKLLMQLSVLWSGGDGSYSHGNERWYDVEVDLGKCLTVSQMNEYEYIMETIFLKIERVLSVDDLEEVASACHALWIKYARLKHLTLVI